MRINRMNSSALGRWWWTVDRTAWFALMLLMALGVVLIIAASPPVAERLGYGSFHFVWRQLFFVGLAAAGLFITSLFSQHNVRRLAVVVFVLALICMLLLPLIGFENKGATRWIRFMGFSLQPSEFMKPCFAVLIGWVFAERYKTNGFPAYRIGIGLFVLVAALLLAQPDFGMTLTLSVMFGIQFLLAGLSFVWVFALVAMGIVGIVLAYNQFSHVKARIDKFLDPSSGDTYQVDKSLEAFKNGGLFGQGPGEGQVKHHIPDSHTDFIFAVAGEEFGLIMSLLLIGIFAFIVLRGYLRLWREKDMFVVIAVGGILAQFAVQAIVNMGVAVSLLPAKGMTLPFISYGGSSLLSVAMGMGMMLALTRKRFGHYSVKM